MLDILNLTTCLSGLLSSTQIACLKEFITAFYLTTYATTTRSLSRYTGYSLRSLFRFLSSDYDWTVLRIRIFMYNCYNPNMVWILVADETVEGKSRSRTFGIDWYYSSIAGKTIKSISFFGISLVRVDTGTSFFLGVEQVFYNSADRLRIAQQKKDKQARSKRSKEAAAKGEKLSKGRKAGTKNKPKEEKENDTASFRIFKILFLKVIETLRSICKGINVRHMVLDNAYATADYASLLLEKGIYMVSKFKNNVKLVLPYVGEQKGKRKKVYGDKLDTNNPGDTYLYKTETIDGYETRYYQLKVYASGIFGAQLINVVIIITKRLRDGKESKTILFSNDLELAADDLVTYYKLRFQIEFDFRDAKQHFGLSDFKNYKQKNLTNFVNLSFTMCLVSKIHLEHYRTKLNIPKLGIIDFKAIMKARFYAKNMIKLFQNAPNPILYDQIAEEYMPDDLIHAA